MTMSMFDTYQPRNPLRCPACGLALEEWQGKDGPCALFLWVEGLEAPQAQELDDDIALPPEERGRVRLPPVFTIYSFDCPSHSPIEAVGSCAAGVWSATALRAFKG